MAGKKMASPRSEIVEGLERGLRVIEAFNENDTEMTLTEVATKTGLKPATARRSLLTLEALGYVRSEKGRYLLSARIMALGASYLRSSNIGALLLPPIRQLVELVGDNAGLGVRVDFNVLYIAHYFLPGNLQQVASTGSTSPAHTTAAGRILLADLAERDLEKWLAQAPLTKSTEFTETNPQKLKAIIVKAGKQGYATVRDERYLGMTALAVPVFDPNGQTIAALNTSAYSGHFTEKQIVSERLKPLQQAAAGLSRTIGSHPLLLNSLRTTAIV
ncbi:helix-turn-helix domain-containing protein [Bradyrhizobium sp. 190]|uniref:IclR family transcriptional regulator n=1 Tax=Bradyrhizobium sp. 190 TaxID=2782658 RepID=UPI001FF7F218|nr:IclR family transcriptional regulator C-terminal domain-containing protein [Bradyrhizobium sp. 190]MCK1513156.1 helix-turn-helix domain-containing protein [Bradyrhizobium sp. 190]